MSDAAGQILAVGSDVRGFAVGDHVVSTFFPDWSAGAVIDAGFTRAPGNGIGGYAREMVTCSANNFTRASAGLSHLEAATLPCAGLTAWRVLVVEGNVKAGDTVLVLATGGVSIFSLQIAKATVATVIATSSSDKKLQKLLALGAGQVINYNEEPRWGRLVRSLTQGRGADHVIEVIGAQTLPQSRRLFGQEARSRSLASLSGLQEPAGRSPRRSAVKSFCAG